MFSMPARSGEIRGSRAALAVWPGTCMMPAMTDWNFLTVIVVFALFALWNLELVATLLNLKAFPAKVPAELADLMDEEKLDRARDYLVVNARLNVVQSAVSLCVLLAFWFVGGFAWLDGLARSLAPNEVTAGLVFLSALFLGQA
jgi:STE24 endopeptidase